MLGVRISHWTCLEGLVSTAKTIFAVKFLLLLPLILYVHLELRVNSGSDKKKNLTEQVWVCARVFVFHLCMVLLLDTAAVKEINGEEHRAAAPQITCHMRLLSKGSNKCRAICRRHSQPYMHSSAWQKQRMVAFSLGGKLAPKTTRRNIGFQRALRSQRPARGRRAGQTHREIDIISQITKTDGMDKKKISNVNLSQSLWNW